MSTTKTTATSSYGKFLCPALAALALAAGAAMVHAAPQDSPTVGEKMDTAEKKVEKVVADSWITTKVKSEILANSASKAFKVQVKTKGGVVSLNGKLPTKDAVDLVKLIAEKVKGVRSVDAAGLTVEG